MIRSIGVIFLSAALVACSSSITFPERQPYAEGTIMEVLTETSSIWVKESAAEECGTIFDVGVGTRIGGRGADGSVKRRDFESLTVGLAVRVWVPEDVSIADSCPAKALAEAIEILTDG